MSEIDVLTSSVTSAPPAFWGWEIPVYLFLGGLAAGAMILSSLLALRGGERSAAARMLTLAAPALVSVGMLALFLDLAHKAYVWRFYLALRVSSPMSWGAWILVLVYPLSAAFGLSSLDAGQWERVRRWSGRAGLARPAEWLRGSALGRERGLAWAHLAVGVVLGVYTGILLSTLGARALWSSALLGPLFLASGLSAGAALFLLFRLAEEERSFLIRWDLLAVGLEALLLALYLVGLSAGGRAAKEAAHLLLGGRYTAAFWTIVVIGGLAVPALLELLEQRLHGERTATSALRPLAAAPLLVLAGGFALRWILVAAGQR